MNVESLRVSVRERTFVKLNCFSELIESGFPGFWWRGLQGHIVFTPQVFLLHINVIKIWVGPLVLHSSHCFKDNQRQLCPEAV